MGGATVAGEGRMARGGSSFKHHLLGQQVRDHTLVVSGLASPPKFFFFYFLFLKKKLPGTSENLPHNQIALILG